MAAEISAFKERHSDQKELVDVFKRPGLGVIPPVPIAAAPGNRSAAMPPGTRFARIFLSASVRMFAYTPPAGADNTAADPDGADGLSEFFDKGEHVIGIEEGHKIAIVAAVSA